MSQCLALSSVASASNCYGFLFEDGVCRLLTGASDLPDLMIIDLQITPNIWIRDAEQFMKLEREVHNSYEVFYDVQHTKSV